MKKFRAASLGTILRVIGAERLSLSLACNLRNPIMKWGKVEEEPTAPALPAEPREPSETGSWTTFSSAGEHPSSRFSNILGSRETDHKAALSGHNTSEDACDRQEDAQNGLFS